MPSSISKALLVLASLMSMPSFASDDKPIALNNKPFIVGAVSEKVKSRIKWSLPLAEYLANNLKEYGYTHGEVVVVPTLEEMAEQLKNGHVHLLPATVYSALIYEKRADTNILVRRWKNGTPTYHSIIFGRKDGQALNFNELNGKTVLFEQPNSNSSFFIPAVALIGQGYKLQYLKTHTDKPDADKVGYMFINQQLKNSNEINISSWVYQRRADLGAFSDRNWNSTEDIPNRIKQSVEIVYESSLYPRDLMISSPTLSPEMNLAIKNTLKAMHLLPEAKATLVQFQRTSQFDELNHEMLNVIDEARQHLSKIEALQK
ncbi:phosphate/phosphite/phosphonate ABC transporter substrate-binding protein [Vibrio sp. S9_S30]|uniref:phosphate/phosphite/phosphonate ABC transporter substrate-binding protein n=1 Tax=Vibrio sp. S9_S30 TaxID=2720226 RepID=UPI0016802836|nr:PhnD/SsuA/transferrin family substrate-binding protein [Vibrio sp. S9_S30]MBD1556780.1 phosphate/phosphite/phosphonate ABC transporter substrate-binding protein [Vibrio sp. S9_S30]